MKFKRKKVSADDEKQILINMITSTTFLKEVFHIAKKEYFITPCSATIHDWITEYFVNYNEAPKEHIQDLYNVYKHNLNSEELSLITIFLQDLNDKYEEKFNEPYYLDKALLYFRKRALEYSNEQVKSLLAIDKVEEAEKVMTNYKKVLKDTSKCVNPNDPAYIEKVFNEDKEKDRLIKFPGILGDLLGWFCRGYLVVFQAPFKMGKCIHGDSEITLADGSFKSIREIANSFDKNLEISAVSLDNNGKFNSSRIIDARDSGKQQCFLLKTRTGREIIITANHPLLSVNGWKKLSDLKSGDYIALPKETQFWGEKKCDIFRIKLLAYLLADGCIVNRHFTFTKINSCVQEDFKQCLEKIGDKCKNLKHDHKTLTVSRGIRRKNKASHIREWMEDINVKFCKSKCKEIPNYIFELNKDGVRQFIKTLFTCNGSIYKTSTWGIEYCSASHKFTRQLSALITKFGIIHQIKFRKVKLNGKYFNANYIIIRDKNNIIKFINEIGFDFSKGEIAQKCLLELENIKAIERFIDIIPVEILKQMKDRHSNKYDEILWERIRLNKNMTKNNFKEISCKFNDEIGLKECNSEYFWDKIVLIEDAGLCNTFDLSIEGNHNFIANNIIVHNSFAIDECRLLAAQNRLKSVGFNFEMTTEQLAERYWQRVTGAPRNDESGEFLYPYFDCLYNQIDTCELKWRENHIQLYKSKKPKDPSLTPTGYKPCAICRLDQKLRHHYKQEVWFKSINKDPITEEFVKKRTTALTRTYGDFMRIQCLPRGSANVDDIRQTLDILEYTENFVPSVITVDYATIMGAEREAEGGNEEGKLDKTLLKLAGLAAERHCLVATASQVKTEVLKKSSTRMGDASQSSRAVYAHPTIVIGIMQTSEEKDLNAKRFNVVAHRFKPFNPLAEVVVLQQLDCGQMILDSDWVERE